MLSPTNTSRKRRTEYRFYSEIVTAITTRNAYVKTNNRKTKKKVDHHKKNGGGGTQVAPKGKQFLLLIRYPLVLLLYSQVR
jgi:hypothetical protein